MANMVVKITPLFIREEVSLSQARSFLPDPSPAGATGQFDRGNDNTLGAGSAAKSSVASFGLCTPSALEMRQVQGLTFRPSGNPAMRLVIADRQSHTMTRRPWLPRRCSGSAIERQSSPQALAFGHTNEAAYANGGLSTGMARTADYRSIQFVSTVFLLESAPLDRPA